MLSTSQRIEQSRSSEEIRSFMDMGDRNTAKMGHDLCERLNILELHSKEEIKLTDCDAIYSGNNR